MAVPYLKGGGGGWTFVEDNFVGGEEDNKEIGKIVLVINNFKKMVVGGFEGG